MKKVRFVVVLGKISDSKNKALTWVRKKIIIITFGGFVKYSEFKKKI